MLKELDKLVASELEILVKAPLLVCILIAGADNEIDSKEIKGAIELAKKGMGKTKAKDNLAQFYEMVSEDFEDKLKIILQSFPNESTERNPLVLDELSRLNKILPKIDKSFSVKFYNSLLYIAKKIAQTSGGVLGMKKVGDEEIKFLNLPMIRNPSTL